jgi:hypothetical protein
VKTGATTTQEQRYHGILGAIAFDKEKVNRGRLVHGDAATVGNVLRAFLFDGFLSGQTWGLQMSAFDAKRTSSG